MGAVSIRAISATPPRVPSAAQAGIFVRLPFMRAVASVERGLALWHDRSSAPMLLLRWDTVFFTPFQPSALNWSLFYQANWCRSTRATGSPALGDCYQLTEFRDRWCPDAGSPDYWLASNVSSMRRVFIGLIDDLASHTFSGVKCPVFHGVLSGRLRYLSTTQGLELGRYKYMDFDFQYARWPFWHPLERAFLGADARPVNKSYVSPRLGERLWLEEREIYDIRQPQALSVCGPSLHYCGCVPHNEPILKSPLVRGEIMCPFVPFKG